MHGKSQSVLTFPKAPELELLGKCLNSTITVNLDTNVMRASSFDVKDALCARPVMNSTYPFLCLDGAPPPTSKTFKMDNVGLVQESEHLATIFTYRVHEMFDSSGPTRMSHTHTHAHTHTLTHFCSATAQWLTYGGLREKNDV